MKFDHTPEGPMIRFESPAEKAVVLGDADAPDLITLEQGWSKLRIVDEGLALDPAATEDERKIADHFGALLMGEHLSSIIDDVEGVGVELTNWYGGVGTYGDILQRPYGVEEYRDRHRRPH